MGSLRFFITDLLENPLTLATVLLGLLPVVLGLAYFVLSPKLFLLILKNLRRSPLRSTLTSLAIMMLVFVLVIIWTVVLSLERYTQEKETNFKLIVSEKWSVPSMMPPKFADYLNPAKSDFILDPRDVGPRDFMSWSFYEGTTRKDVPLTVESITFFFIMDPDHIRPMMDDLEDLDEDLVHKLKDSRQAILLGPERLAALNKRVGERFKVYGVDYKDIDLEVEVVGQLPAGRYAKSGIMNKAHFDSALEKYKAENKQAHPLAGRSLNYVWLRVPDKAVFVRVAHQIETSPYFKAPEVKCETAASAIASFMEPYSDLLWCVEYLLVPVILVIQTLVMANAIGISVRERREEIAVLKVLGFRPRQILVLVVGEPLLLGALSGLLSAALTFAAVNSIWGGVPFQDVDEFFPDFPVPVHAFWWGLAAGSFTAFVGSFLPAWSASSVKVSEVFARVA
jgi:putative ABC transport system permease protein